MFFKKDKKNRAFTLIEMLIVISIVGIAVPIIVTIFGAVMRQQIQTKKLVETKNQADFVLNSVKIIVKNHAFSLHNSFPASTENEICQNQSETQTPTSMVFEDLEGESFYFDLQEGVVASVSSVLAEPVELSSKPVAISDLVVSCSRSSFFASPLVRVSFTATHEDTRLGVVALPFQTRISLRNE